MPMNSGRIPRTGKPISSQPMDSSIQLHGGMMMARLVSYHGGPRSASEEKSGREEAAGFGPGPDGAGAIIEPADTNSTGRANTS